MSVFGGGAAASNWCCSVDGGPETAAVTLSPVTLKEDGRDDAAALPLGGGFDEDAADTGPSGLFVVGSEDGSSEVLPPGNVSGGEAVADSAPAAFCEGRTMSELVMPNEVGGVCPGPFSVAGEGPCCGLGDDAAGFDPSDGKAVGGRIEAKDTITGGPSPTSLWTDCFSAADV